MAAILATHTDYNAAGFSTAWALHGDGTVTVTDADGNTVTVPPTPETAAQAQAIVAAEAAEAAAAERQRRLDALLDLDPAVIAAATEKVAAVEKALVDKAVLTAKDISDAVVAEPVDEVAVVKP